MIASTIISIVMNFIKFLDVVTILDFPIKKIFLNELESLRCVMLKRGKEELWMGFGVEGIWKRQIPVQVMRGTTEKGSDGPFFRGP